MNRKLRMGLLALSVSALSTIAIAQSFTTFPNVRVTTQLDVQGTVTANGSTGTSGQVLTSNGSGDVTWSNAPGGTPANPTASVGLTAVNGVASTYMRSDGAPALSQSIAPTWSATHEFSLIGGGLAWPIELTSTLPGFMLSETDGTTDNKHWRVYASNEELNFDLRNDANSAGNPWLRVNRSGVTIDSIALNATALTWNGNGLCSSTGTNCPGSITGFANPTGTIGLTAVNGSATTAMRSDAAPALSQAISPTWTGTHRWSADTPAVYFTETDGAADSKNWIIRAANGNTLSIATATDAAPTSVSTSALQVTRSGTSVDTMNLNSTALTWNGTSMVNLASTPVWTGQHSYSFASGPAVTISNALPQYDMNETDAASGERRWRWDVQNEQLRGRITDDAGSAATSWITIDRSANVVDGISLNATALTWNGSSMVNQSSSPTWTGTHAWSGSAPRLRLNSTGAGTDEKQWHIQSSSVGSFVIQSRTDADGSGRTLLQANRTGTAVTSVDIGNTTDDTAVNVYGQLLSEGQVEITASGASRSVAPLYINAAAPYMRLTETDQVADARDWILGSTNGLLTLNAVTDAATGPSTAGRVFEVTRSSSNISDITLGNATSNPSFTWNGTGPWSVGGSNGTAGQVLTSNGSTSPTWQNAPGGTPGGADTQVQYNNAGAFGGDAGMTYNAGTDTLTVGNIAGNGSALTSLDAGDISAGTLTVARGGTGAGTLTGLLQGNGTSAVTAITNSTTVGQTLRVTGSNTYAWGALDLADADARTGTLPVTNGGTGTTTSTGTGSVVLSASPTLTGTTTAATVAATSLTVGGQNVCLANGTNCALFGTKFAAAFITISAGSCVVSTASADYNVPSCTRNVAGNVNVELSWSAATLPTCTTSLSGSFGFIRPGPIDANTVNVVTGDTSGTNADLNFYLVCFGD